MLGALCRIWRAASRPFITGIEKSKITTSGHCSMALSIATWPFSASPHTCQSVWVSMKVRIRWRMAELSSTIRIFNCTYLPTGLGRSLAKEGACGPAKRKANQP